MSEVEALRDEITALEAAKQLILQKLISERSSVLRKDKEVQQAKQQCDFISAEYKHLESENALLRTSVAELESDLGAARSSLQDATKSSSGSEAVLRGRLAETDAELRSLKSKVYDLERIHTEEKAVLKGEIEELKSQSKPSSVIEKMQADIDEKDLLIVEQDSIIDEERRKATDLEAELQKERQLHTRILDEKEKVIGQLRGGHEDLLKELTTLKETYASEMEKKKQFSVVFLKLKSEFEEQKKKLAAYEAHK